MTQTADVFGAYDIRGIAGTAITDSFAGKLGRSYANYICPQGPGNFLIGHDSRTSSPALAEALIQGLIEGGHCATHIGLTSTPLVYWYGAQENFDGSIVVTASHLPAQYNGFKLCRRDAVTLSADDGLDEIAAALDSTVSGRNVSVGTITTEALARQKYIDHLQQHLAPERPLAIAVDAGGGTAGPEVEMLFKQRSAITLHGIGLAPDSFYSLRSSNPLEKGALSNLSKLVVAKKCSFGAAFDGDADRIVIVDEQGAMIAPDLLTCLIAACQLASYPGSKILYDLRSSRTVPESIAASGGIPIKTCVGHSYIKRAMRQVGASFAGELSGHYYYCDLHYTDNALRTLIELVNLLSSTEKTLSALVSPLRKYSTSGEINLRVKNTELTLEKLEKSFPDGRKDHLDGLSIDYADWWFNARASRTEPILRLTVEASEGIALQRHVDNLLSLIEV